MYIEDERTGSCIAFGTATSDAKQKSFGDNDTQKMTFSIAVNAYGTDSEYCDCDAISYLTFEAAMDIKKGDTVEVFGFAKKRKYEGKTYTTINCQRLQRYAKKPYPQKATPQSAPVDEYADMDESDLPF